MEDLKALMGRRAISPRVKQTAMHLLEAGLSAREVARRIGLSNNTASRWKKNKTHAGRPKRIRPDIRWDGVYRQDRAFKLSIKDYRELIRITELERDRHQAKAMLSEAREELSMYRDMEKAMDHGPRPAHKLIALELLLRRAKAGKLDLESEGLTLALWARTGPLAWEFRGKGFPWNFDGSCSENMDGEALRQKFVEIGEQVCEDLRKLESRHGPTRRALSLLILKLCHVFDTYNQVTTYPHRLKVDFVSVALEAAGINCSKLDVKATASRSRLVRLIRKLSARPCAACRSAKLNREEDREPLIRDLALARIEELVDQLQSKYTDLRRPEIYSRVMHSRGGMRLYRIYSSRLNWLTISEARALAEDRKILGRSQNIDVIVNDLNYRLKVGKDEKQEMELIQEAILN